MNQQTPSSDHLVPTRKLSLGSLTSQDSNIPHHISRRLSTLSLQSATDERSNSCLSRNHDYHSRNCNILNSKFGVQGRKDSHDNFMLSLHRQDYLSDTDESARNQTKKDFLAPGRRSLSLLDSKDRDCFSISTHRAGSASDCDVYGHHRKPLGMDKVLPPLPCSAGSHGRRKEAGRSSSSARQRSTNVGGGPYEDDLNGSGHNLNHSTIPEETAYDRPHHSSSLPSVTRTKERKCFSSCAGKMNTEFKTTSNSNVDSSCNASVDPRSVSSYSALPSQLNISKFGSMNNSSSVLGSMPDVRSKYQDRSFRKSNSNATSSSEYKGRSRIPSLLHFRSSSVSCEVEKQKKVNFEEGTDPAITPRSTISCSTPDRSVLSKFFRQGCGEKDRRQQVQPAGEEKDAAKKKRRISRFLRPDFFDTPREESIYAKEKDANKAEDKTKLKLRKNIQRLAAEKNGSMSHVQAVLETGSSSSHSEEKLETNLITAFPDSINTDKDNINLKNRDSETKQIEEQSGEQIKSVNEMEEKSKSMNDAKKTEKSCSTFEKLSNNVNKKSQFLHSLEKKLEKFRSSGDYIPSTSTSGKSRVDKAIRSLREQSLAPRSGDIVTSESHLLKRAVSVSDCYTVESTSKNYLPSTNENSRSKLRNKVTAVLDLFRNLEVTPVKTCQSSSVQPSLLSRLRRTQSVYAGSHSDSVLLGPDVDVSGSPEFKTFPPLCLKKISSNTSVVKKKPIARDVKIQKGNLETNKSTETDLQDPGLNTLEHPTTDHSTELTTENTLESETVPCNSNTTQDICVLEGIIATKQEESSVPKLLKRGSIKSNKKNTHEGSSQAQSNNDVSANSDTKIMSVLEHDKCSEEQVNMRSVIQGNTKPDRPTSLTGLKGTIAYKGMKVPKPADIPVVKLEVPTNKNDDVSLVTQEVASDARAMCIPSKVEKSINHLGKNKNNCVKRESSTHMSCTICTDACNANELGSCKISGVSPTTDAVFANSLADEYTLKEDEIKFANVKHLSLCLFPSADSSVLSPPHELESSDSRSVCSDFENHEFPPSPVSPSGDEVEESVGDRIRRKSFYSRFNDIKRKHRKSSLSSVGSFPLSYQDPNSVSLLHYPRNFLRKKGHSVDYAINTSHSVHLPLKSHRSQSFHVQNDYNDRLSSYARRSPVPYTSQHSSYTEGCVNSLHAENMTSEMSEYVDDISVTDKNDLWDGSQKASVPVDEAGQTALCAGGSVPVLGGSTETLRMPRHFQYNVHQDTLPYQSLYPDTMIRGSDSCFSRSTESSIGTAIPKSHLPTIRDRHSSLAPGFASKSSVGVTGPDSAVHLGSVAGESLPLHGKCNR